MVTDEETELADFETQAAAGVINPNPYNRLMVAYRKQKQYKDELRIIKRAISVFEGKLKNDQNLILKGNRKRSAIAKISAAISLQTGLTDKKGKSAHVPEPVATWIKRKATVEKKLGTPAAKEKPAKKAR